MQPEPVSDLEMALLLGGWHLIQAIGAAGILAKAGRPVWKAFVPVVNFVELSRVAGVSAWWLMAIFVPGLNLAAAVYFGIRLNGRFGGSTAMGIAYALTGFVLLPVLGFNRSKFGDRREETHTPLLTERQKTRAWLISLSVLYGFALLCAPGAMVIGVMAFDAPGAVDNQGLWIAFGSVMLAPITIIVALIGGWLLYARRRDQWALWTVSLPGLHVIGFIVGLFLTGSGPA